MASQLTRHRQSKFEGAVCRERTLRRSQMVNRSTAVEAAAWGSSCVEEAIEGVAA